MVMQEMIYEVHRQALLTMKLKDDSWVRNEILVRPEPYQIENEPAVFLPFMNINDGDTIRGASQILWA